MTDSTDRRVEALTEVYPPGSETPVPPGTILSLPREVADALESAGAVVRVSRNAGSHGPSPDLSPGVEASPAA